MAYTTSILERLEELNIYQRAHQWDQLLHTQYSSTWERIVHRTKAMGTSYIWASLIHYFNKIVPAFGTISLPSKTFFGERIWVELRIVDLFSIIGKGMPPDIQEVRLIYYLAQRQLSGEVFYDIGANIGFYSMLAAALGAKVHAFEPLPHTFKLLEKNLSPYPNVQTNNIALSNQCGKLVMYYSYDWSGFSTLQPEMLRRIDKTITVDALTLDSYVFEYSHEAPTIVKLDVEGAEQFVLHGGKQTLIHYRPTIAMEVSPPHRHGLTLSLPAVDYLRNLGYTLHTIGEKGILNKVETDTETFLSTLHGDFENVIFLPDTT